MSRCRQVMRQDVPQNWAESLINLAAAVLRRVRRGAGIEEASRECNAAPDIVQLALAFHRSPDLLKLRALVEDWPLDRIASGGAGNDYLEYVGSCAARINGGTGHDNVFGGSGDDELRGGPGNDRALPHGGCEP